MASEWIHERYKTYRDRLEKQKRKEMFQGNALAASPTLFRRLRDQMFSDVQEYNAVFGRFPSDKHCRAFFEDINSSVFAITVADSGVRVTRQPDTTIICAEYTGEAAKTRSVDCFEALPNDEGKVDYWHGDKGDFVDEEQASKTLLEPILC